MWYAQREDAKEQRLVDKEQTEALNAVANQGERTEATLTTALALLSRPTTANPGGGIVQ
jgi:hypothetical protein